MKNNRSNFDDLEFQLSFNWFQFKSVMGKPKKSNMTF